MVGGKAVAEAGAVTHGAVRCSAWLGDIRFGFAVMSLEKCCDASSNENRNASGEKADRRYSDDRANVLKPTHGSNGGMFGDVECRIENKAEKDDGG